MLKLVKNCKVYAPSFMGMKNLVIGGEKILSIQDVSETSGDFTQSGGARSTGNSRPSVDVGPTGLAILATYGGRRTTQYY
jgi:hypothetical protein